MQCPRCSRNNKLFDRLKTKPKIFDWKCAPNSKRKVLVSGATHKNECEKWNLFECTKRIKSSENNNRNYFPLFTGMAARQKNRVELACIRWEWRSMESTSSLVQFIIKQISFEQTISHWTFADNSAMRNEVRGIIEKNLYFYSVDVCYECSGDIKNSKTNKWHSSAPALYTGTHSTRVTIYLRQVDSD